jgi:hypothetical protein
MGTESNKPRRRKLQLLRNNSPSSALPNYREISLGNRVKKKKQSPQRGQCKTTSHSRCRQFLWFGETREAEGYLNLGEEQSEEFVNQVSLI